MTAPELVLSVSWGRWGHKEPRWLTLRSRCQMKRRFADYFITCSALVFVICKAVSALSVAAD